MGINLQPYSTYMWKYLISDLGYRIFSDIVWQKSVTKY